MLLKELESVVMIFKKFQLANVNERAELYP